MTLTKDRTALLVVDMQNGFLDAEGSMARIGMPHEALTPALPGSERLVAAAREAGVPVIYTRYVYQPGYVDGGLLPNELVPQMAEVQALVDGTWDAEIVPSLKPGPGEVVIDKSRPSSFYGTQLEPVLTSQDIRTLVICGVTTNICVETTARDAGQRDYRVHVVSDAVAEYDPTRNEVALGTIGFAFGWLATTDEVVAAWA
ncbi:isochorismatase family cysteine hydrolase [Nocardioides sp. TF02-7]|uniref:cysteine hydrolase family protein n=1 Tax=Nocardioides sp. TF02-7 TaxID=2917724 RepID=UPI001F05D942|nr:isochorismatase family cysteine hydrolase [Nocardioides sp. TF02-7]UMG93685.1 cysteine hydrolase [Nocardioides sp. TF02-7]